jgi:FkbM family methyltransferase
MLHHFRTIYRHISRNPLTRSKRFRALGRYIHHQILIRFGQQQCITGFLRPFVNNTNVVVRPGGYLNGISTFGLPELPEMAFILHALSPEDVFVDVGANVGAFTLLASGVVGAKSIAVEPIPSVLRELRVNLSLNGIEDLVTIMPVAVGDATGIVQMESQRDQTNRISMDKSSINNSSIPLTTLDDIVSLNSQNTPNLMIKIDVEGYETPVLQGAIRLLKSGIVKALIIELMGQGSRYGYDEEALHKQLLSLGYESCEYDPLTRQLHPNAPHQPSMKKYTTDSTIYVNNLNRISENLKQGPRYHIHGLNIDL